MISRIFFRSGALILSLMLLFPVTAFASDESAQAPDVKNLISKVIEAYGGKETIGSLKSVYAKGKIHAFMRGGKGTYVRYFKRGRKLRVETLFSNLSEVRVLNGSRGWRGSDKGPLPEADGHRYLAMVFQYKRLDLPYGLMTGAYEIKSTGSDLLRGKQVKVLELTDSEGPPLKIFIDPGSFYIIKAGGYFKIADSIVELSAEFSDFRIINGMPFPFKISNYAGGHKVGETVIEEYSVNSVMDDSLFKP
jgi:hypothetical protein